MDTDRKPPLTVFDQLTHEEKAAARRAELFATHKVRGSLGTYYQLYPDERPIPPPRRTSDPGRER